jgi:diguanylate cyclase (GGDEF)-like protein
MTTDIINNNAMNEMSKAVGALFGSAYGTTDSIGQTKNVINDAKDQILKSEGQERLLNSLLALLKSARFMIDDAESLLVEKDKKLYELESLLTTDELTGLKNRRGFFESFSRELECCNRGVSAGGLLILIDLDNFKMVNDRFGHLAGDACLRLVGKTTLNEIRTMDIAARLGGDEFVLLLSNTTKCEAAKRAQEIALKLNNLAVAWYGEEIPIQASLGLREYSKGECIENIFNDADFDMYQKKNERKRMREK